MAKTHYLSEEDFISVYSKVPRLTVDIVVNDGNGVLLSLRKKMPYKGYWNLPGGTVYKGEKIASAALRVARNELGLKVKFLKGLGFDECLAESRDGFSKPVHSVGIVVEVKLISGTIRVDENAERLAYFNKIPKKIVAPQRKIIKELLNKKLK